MGVSRLGTSPYICVVGIPACIFCSILLWDYPEGMTAAQGLELLQRKVEILGGKSLGPWSVECETLQSTQTLSELSK